MCPCSGVSFALVVSFQPDTTGIAGTTVRSDALGIGLQLLAVASAVLGIVGGTFLPVGAAFAGTMPIGPPPPSTRPGAWG